VPNDIPNAFSRLSMVGKARFIVCLVHAETIHARDAYTANSDAADGVRLRARNETVHRLSGVLKALLGERLSADHHDYMVGLIELIAASHRREELERWMADAAET
jgi:hypothetical protein